MILLRLFFEFFKTGLFAVGGGMATVPFLYDISARTGWFSAGQLADMIAISESTPGPIGVNMATYVGYITAGIPGAICATLGLITPCVVIILIIAKVLQQFRTNKTVDSVFYGLRPCSVGLIAAAGLLVAKITFINENVLNIKGLILAVVLIVLTRYVPKIKSLHPIIFIAFSAVVGILFSF